MQTHPTPPQSPVRFRRVHGLSLLSALMLAASIGAASPSSRPAHDIITQAHAAGLSRAAAEETVALKVGEVLERELKGRESNKFGVSLEAGQYARLVIERRGIDLLITIVSPDGRASMTYENPAGEQSPIHASIFAESTGEYAVEVRPVEKWAAAGRYSIRVDEVRARVPEDERRATAERKTAEAQRQQLLETADGWRAAVAEYRAALALWEELGDRFEAANTLHSIAQTYKAMSMFDESRRYYELTVERRGEADQQALGYTLLDMGEAQRDLRNPLDAVPIFERALAVFKQSNNRRGEATATYDIGFSHMRRWDMDRAIGYLKTALELFRAEGMRYEEARTLNSLGGAHDVLLKQQEAIEFYKAALAGWDATGDASNKGLTLNNLGKLYDDMGEWQTALEHYDLSLRSYEAAEPVNERHRAAFRNRKATTLYNLAYTHLALGDLPKTFDYLRQSLALREEPRGRGVTLTMIGYAYTLSGEPQRALESCQQALPLLTETKDPRRSQTLATMGIAYGKLGNQQKAIEAYQQALELQQNPDTSDLQGLALTLYNLGGAYAAHGETDKALATFERALALWRSFGERNGEALTLFQVARVERARGNADAALKYAEEAIARTELLRGNVTNRRLRASYLAIKLGYYELYIDLKMRGEPAQTEAAFEASERARSRGLLDMLSDGRVDVSADADPSLAALVEQRRRLLRELRAGGERRVRMMLDQRKAEELAEADRELARLDAERERIETQIKSTHPRYAALMFPRPLDVREVQQLLDRDTLLLEFFLGEEGSYLWALTPNEVSGHRLPPRSEIESAARHLKELLRAGQPLPGETAAQHLERATRAEADYWREAAALSRVLLGPVAARLKGKRLLIVADGELLYLPFGALPSPDASAATPAAAAPLILGHEVVSVPSASVLAALRQSARNAPAAKSVAVFADPVFEKDDPRIRAAARGVARPATPGRDDDDLVKAVRDTDETGEGASLTRLPSTSREARHILSVAPGGTSMEATGFKATRANATDARLAQYRIVHFATHGILDEKRPELSGLVLSLYDEQGHYRKEGFLRLSDIYALNLPVELVVLSACRTGLGEEVRGEGLIGLTRGFMYAGAPRVVASLWKVDDEATAELMKRFYQKMLGEGLAPAAALRAAQASMSEQRRWSNPYYWAAFVLHGEWR